MTVHFQRTIPEVLRLAAQRTPDKPAFIFEGTSLTYAQLIARSEKLAATLLGQGVRKGDRVGIFLPQSLDSAVAVFGILMAGAIFVPIDPTAPALRMKDIVGRCDVSVVVTVPSKRAAIEAFLEIAETPLEFIGVGDLAGPMVTDCVTWDAVETAATTDLPRASVQDLAYIMWTSGSTGQPKGMTHSHGNGLIYAGMLAETHDLNADDIFLGLSPLHFDMAVMDYFAVILVGGTTVIVPEATAKMPAALTLLIEQERATVWYSVPFGMTQMLERGAMEARDLTSLRWMIFGGEPFSIKHLRALMARLPNAQFANAFGPAETHQISSHTVEEADLDAGTIPVGKPWRTLDALILDEDDTDVPPGEVGELVVRSPSCMRGYWGDPEQTRASFYTRAISDDMSDAYYRTGDLVRLDDQGRMHFLGRKGRQVKVRGYRIELDEVESVLLSCDGAEEVAVVRSADKTRLIAVVRSDGKTDGLEGALLAHCRSLLPIYAVPSEVRFIEVFERTRSNKIDRTRLEARLASEET